MNTLQESLEALIREIPERYICEVIVKKCSEQGVELSGRERRKLARIMQTPGDGKMGRAIRAAARRLQDLERKRSKVPRRIPVGERAQGEVVKLSTERKHLTNILKMVAYQAESDLFRALASHYRRNEDEGRTLIQTALAGAANLEVAEDELRVTLAPLSSPHRSRAVAALCRELDDARATFPGTRLRLRFAVAGHA